MIRRLLRMLLRKKYAISLGGSELVLNLRNRHEKQYYEKYDETIDFLIASRFVTPGMDVLDLGANIGLTALFYVQHGARHVAAFEPLPALAARIRRIECSKICVYEKAVSGTSGQRSLRLSTAHDQGHSLNTHWPGIFPEAFRGPSQDVSIAVVALDDQYPEECFDFIKVDIEGSEYDLLVGGRKFFERNGSAIVQIEIYDSLYNSTNELLMKSYRHSVRAIIEESTKRLILIRPDAVSCYSRGYLLQPPVYLYSNRELHSEDALVGAPSCL